MLFCLSSIPKLQHQRQALSGVFGEAGKRVEVGRDMYDMNEHPESSTSGPFETFLLVSC